MVLGLLFLFRVLVLVLFLALVSVLVPVHPEQTNTHPNLLSTSANPSTYRPYGG
jgi:hypothetical protein